MSCIYFYKNHQFDNEIQLDDFLLEKENYQSKYGDLVYSMSQKAMMHIDTIDNKITPESNRLDEIYKNVKKTYIDGEEIFEHAPYVGVNRFLSGLTNSKGELLVPEFIEQNYWNNRIDHWTVDEATLQKDKDPRRFNDDEINFLFDGDASKAVQIDQETAQKYKDLISKKWEIQGKMGTELHKVMQLCFSPENINFVKLKDTKELSNRIKSKINPDLVNDKIFNQALEYTTKLYDNIVSNLGDNDLKFYPELKVTKDVVKLKQGNPDKLMGIIDLLVIDSKGNVHVFDYKTSPKPWDQFSSAKRRAFQYQLAVYDRILANWGIDVHGNGTMQILPIQLDNFRCTNKDDALNDISSAKFEYDNIKYNEGAMSQNITQLIRGDGKLQQNLDEYIPEPRLKDASTEKIIERVTNKMHYLFPRYSNKLDIDRDEIIQDIKKKTDNFKPDKNGNINYRNFSVKANEPDAEKLLLEQVIADQKSNEASRQNLTNSIANALEATQGPDSINLDLHGIRTSHLIAGGISEKWLENVLQKYANGNWEVMKGNAGNTASQFGIIILRNKLNQRQIDFLKVSTARDLKNQHYYMDDNNNKDRNRSNLTYAFETDIVEKSKGESSGMLKAADGNIEMMETMFAINELKSIFNDGFQGGIVGNIQIINPWTGDGLSAPNEQLLYSYKKLMNYYNQKYNDKTQVDEITNGNIKFASLSQLTLINAKDILDTENTDNKGFVVKNSDKFITAKSLIDNINDRSLVEDKINALQRLDKDLVDQYHLGSIVQSDIEKAEAPVIRLHNLITLSIAQLKGINFKQQLKDGDNYIVNKSLGGILTKGLNGNYIDNPGNLDSETLNLVAKQVMEAYQGVREDMSPKISKIRQLVENIKKEKNFGWAEERTIGNQSNLYQNLYENKSGDFLFKRLNDLSLSKAEKEFLEYALDEINTNRYGKIQADEFKYSDNDNYYRVPLAVSEHQLQNNLMDGLQERLKSFIPKVALTKMREKLEGIFDGEDTDYQKADELFDMNTIFDRGDQDIKWRIERIGQHGIDYYEHNLETLLLKHDFAYITKDRINGVFPTIQAAFTYLTVSGEDQQNVKFKNDLKYAEDYVKAIIKHQPIDRDIQMTEARVMVNKLKRAVSFCALAFSPVQGTYQMLQGLWQGISLSIRKPDGTQSFSFKNFSNAFKTVYGDMIHYSDKPTKVQLVNELYGINDMDMNTYVDKIKNDQHGIYNFTNLAFKFSSRPDYYNRMAIMVAQMMADGSWDALSVKDGKLEYDMSKDKRFDKFYQHLKNPSYISNDPIYKKQATKYYAIAQQLVNENTIITDKNGVNRSFKIGDILQTPYSVKETEGFKSLSDLIYGYYSSEKKSLIHYTMLGSMFMQMKTYWSGKKNQYLAPGGVRIMGSWQPVVTTDQQGVQHHYYYQVDENGHVRTDLEPIQDVDTGYEVMQWKGQWQEGILLTLADIIRETWNNGHSYKSFTDAINSKWNNTDLNLQKAYRSNLQQFAYDIVTYFTVGSLIGGLMLGNLTKELEKEARESNGQSGAMEAAAMNILQATVSQSASDFNWWNSIGSPGINWTPFSLDAGKRLFQNTLSVAFGDRTLYGGLINTFSATKYMKPMLEYVAPMNDNNQQ